MAVFKILVTARRQRRRRRDLIFFLESLVLSLQSGFDLAYSWPQTLRSLEGELAPDLVFKLRPLPGEGMGVLLTRLSASYENESHRHWFSAIRELYEQGAGMTDVIFGIACSLRQEEQRDLDSYCQKLPGTINVLLILFILPPTMILLFIPLLCEILESFPQ